MKKWILLLLALVLAGCAGAPASTEPALTEPAATEPPVTGSLTIRYQEQGAQISCNGQTLQIGPETTLTEDTALDCARIRVLQGMGLEISFGEERFLFLPELSPQQQADLAASQQSLKADILQILGVPSRELLSAVELRYLMVPSPVETALPEGLEVLDYASFGPVTAQSDGTETTLSWSFHVSDSVASAGE